MSYTHLLITLCVLVLATAQPSFADRFNPANQGEAQASSQQFMQALNKADNQGLDEIYTSWKGQFGKSYAGTEDANRKAVFKQNLANIAASNMQNSGDFLLAVNRFADLSPSEFASKYLMKPLPMTANANTNNLTVTIRNRKLLAKPGTTTTLPTTAVDQSPYVTSVKDQKSCGSCWAFAAVAAIEARVNQLKGITSGTSTINLTEQQLVDCDTGSSGCNGGSSVSAFSYVYSNNITGESVYPYTAVTGTCNGALAYAGTNTFLKLSGYGGTSYPASGSTGLTNVYNALKTQAVVVYLDGSNLSTYKSGVFTYNACSKTTINHAVLLVGYGYDTATAKYYFRLKNSWGAAWGESGYFRLEASTTSSGTCNMLYYGAMYPSVSATITAMPL